MEIFSERLRSLRKEKKISQDKLADCIGKSRSIVTSYENGREPRYDVLCQIADRLGTTTDFLLGRTLESEVPWRPETEEETEAYEAFKATLNAAKAAGGAAGTAQFATVLKTVMQEQQRCYDEAAAGSRQPESIGFIIVKNRGGKDT